MKLGPVAKHDKKKRGNVKKIDDGVISANCDAIVIFPIYDLFEAI